MIQNRRSHNTLGFAFPVYIIFLFFQYYFSFFQLFLTTCTEMACINTTNIYNYTTSDPDFLNFYILMRKLTGLILYPIVCFLGLALNSVGVIVMSRKPMRSSTSVFLIALAIADLIKILNDTLYFVTVLLIETSSVSGRNTFIAIYPYAHYIFNASMTCSAWINVAVAMERYIFVCHGSKAKFITTINRAIVISLGISAASIVISLPYALKYETLEISDRNKTMYNLSVSPLWMGDNFSYIFNWFHYAIRSIIPVSLLVVASILIVRGLRKCRLRKGKKRISLCVVFVIVVFVVCVFPDTILSTFFKTGYYEASYLAKGIREITDFLLLLHTVMNFILYSIFNKQFAKHTKVLLRYTFRERRRKTTNDETVPLSTRYKDSTACLN
jgi:nociceptin receptor